MAKVTIGIPFYNAERYLEYAIRSVINQSFTDWLLILLDDGSTDSSVSIAKAFQCEKIMVLSDGINRGLVYRLNQLTQLVETPYYSRMDSDDIMHVNRLKNQIAFLDENPDVDLVGSSVCYIDGNNSIYGKGCANITPRSKQDAIKGHVFYHPSITGKTEWFKCHPYDKSSVRMEDFELWMRTIEDSRFSNLPECLLFYREAGLPYLDKYLLSQKGVRRVLRNNLRGLDALKMVVLNYLKCLFFILVTLSHMQGFYFNMKHKRLDANELNSCKKVLLKAISDDDNKYSG